MKKSLKNRNSKYLIAGCLALILVVCILNWRFQVFAFHPFRCEGQHDLNVMTWNVHCSEGAGIIRQRLIAEMILAVDADFVLLNEYNQDSCYVIDSILKTKYPYTEEFQSHQNCGDIYYSKLRMSNSGHVWIPIEGKAIQTIKATIVVRNDSVQIFGQHMASNHHDANSMGGAHEKKKLSYERYKNAQESRCFEAYWTKVAIQESMHPVIVIGDMNDFNGSAPLDTLVSCGMIDAWWEGGNGYGCTFHNGWLRLRIDHILHSKDLKLENIKVIDTDLSDHNPVVAGFSMREN